LQEHLEVPNDVETAKYPGLLGGDNNREATDDDLDEVEIERFLRDHEEGNDETHEEHNEIAAPNPMRVYFRDDNWNELGGVRLRTCDRTCMRVTLWKIHSMYNAKSFIPKQVDKYEHQVSYTASAICISSA
jgi:hypothetical protein